MKVPQLPGRLLACLAGITITLGAASLQADQTWDSTAASGDWNNSANWLPDGRVPTNENAFIESATGNIATITSDFIATPTDIKVGNNGSTARLDHKSGNAQGGSGNWSFIGLDSASSFGTYNLADTDTTTATLSGFAQGTGNMTLTRLYVGFKGNGTVNMNTTGTLTANDFLSVGDSENLGAVTATFNLESGTVNVPNGDFNVGEQTDGVGILNMSGGTINCDGQLWFGNEAGGDGTFNFSGGTVNANSWLTVGRFGGTGAVNQTGGTLIFNENPGTPETETLLVGQAGEGTWTLDAGLVDVQTGFTEIGESNIGVLTINGGQWNTPSFLIAEMPSADGTLELNGGDVHTAGISGGDGIDTVNFNGTQITANGNGTAFIDNIETPTIKGCLMVDTAGFDLSGASPITGAGNVIKSGAGSLRLLGDNDYTGANIILGGTLQVGAHPLAGTGDFDVTAGGGMGVRPIALNDSISPGNVDYSGAGNMDIDFGNLMGMIPTTAPLNVTTNINLGGNVTVNISGELFSVGTFPLVDYAAKSGGGIFVLGTVPAGVTGTINDNGSQVSLTITSVAILPQWDGGITQFWDTTTQNWLDQATLTPVTYTDGQPVLFEDTALFPDVVLNQTVSPAFVEFDNDLLTYTLSGTGNISGSTSFLKKSAELLTITGLANDYTGSTTLEGGTTSVDTLADGGVASSIGASSSAPANLVLAGGTLEYAGTTDTTTDRGFTVTGDGSGIVNAKNLEFSGSIASPSGNLSKSGTGGLTFSNPGAIKVGNTSPGLKANEGSTIFSGSGTQVVEIGGDPIINDGSVATPTAPIVLALIDTTVNTGFLEMNEGEIATTTPAILQLTNSTLNTNGFRSGNDPGNFSAFDAEARIEQSDSAWNNPNEMVLSDTFGSKTTWNVSGSSTVTFDRLITAIASASTADIVIEDNATMTRNNVTGWVAIGNSNDGQGSLTVKDNATLTALGGADLNLGDGGTAVGTLNVQDSGTVDWKGQIFVGKNSATGVINQSGGSIIGDSWINIAGVAGGSTGTVNVSGGHFQHTAATDAGSNINIGDHGLGVLSVSGTGVVSSPNEITLANNATGDGTLNVSGNGLVITPGVVRKQGAGAVTFNGGTLRANNNSADILSADTVELLSGGGTIDSSSFSVTTAQSISGAGGLTKAGSGTLFMNGTGTYSGTTIVTAGTLGGTGSVAGDLIVAASAAIAPGLSAGSFGAGDTTIDGNYDYEIDSSTNDTLVVTGNLTLGAASTLTITELSPATQPSYTVATYTGTISGTFGGGITGLPVGYVIDYLFGGNSVALVSTGATPYDTWIAGFFPGEMDPNVIGPDADPDNDGNPNKVEFMLGGNPDSSTDGPKVYVLTEDSDDGGSDPELLMTIAVRSGTPAFSGSPSPTATRDGFTYTINGSNGTSQMASWTDPVSPVSPVTTGLPTAPTGYEYRTFSLDGSDGLPNLGNLRVNITP